MLINTRATSTYYPLLHQKRTKSPSTAQTCRESEGDNHPVVPLTATKCQKKKVRRQDAKETLSPTGQGSHPPLLKKVATPAQRHALLSKRGGREAFCWSGLTLNEAERKRFHPSVLILANDKECPPCPHILSSSSLSAVALENAL